MYVRCLSKLVKGEARTEKSGGGAREGVCGCGVCITGVCVVTSVGAVLQTQVLS